jgi:serine/threonine protein kinase
MSKADGLERQIFEKAIEIEAPDERAAYVRRECGDNIALIERVNALLRAHDQIDFLPPHPGDEGMTSPESTPSQKPGAMMGPYKLLEKLGEGGFGEIWVAQQKEPVKRRVALKIIKLGMDTRQVVARFEAERQALAMMDHPNIAKVFDAGWTDGGRPYFVMELVRGVSITNYCDQQRLSIHDRLGLFIKVCNAVQHAHQKGIIHRDIKPSNILITLHDGVPVPRIIDFGIAKAMQQELTDKTVYTQFHQFIGTPVYMSPEQAEMSGLDIDTRSDIYSLGVLLYELLTGRTPFDERELMQSGIDQMRKIIREQEPQKPSTRFATLQFEEQSTTATRHSTNTPKLVSLLRGDLDWIVMKSLEKDRTRRYETANEFAMDVARHLGDEPVSAGPPSVGYRLSKFLRRNRALVTSIAVVMAVLVAGSAISAIFAIRAQRQAKVAQAVADFLTDDLLGSVAPEKVKSPEVTVHSILDAASKSLEGRFGDKPLIEASIREKLGETYGKLGDYDSAEPHLERAYRIRAEQLGEEDLSTLTSMNQLGSLYFLQARYDDAEPLLVGAWQIRRRLLGEEHPHTLASAVKVAWLSFLGVSLSDNAVEDLFVKTRQASRRVLGDEHSVTLEATRGLATLYYGMARYEEAEPLCNNGLEIAQRVLSAEHEATLEFMNLLAMLHCQRGRYRQGTELVTRALQIGERVLGKEHPTTIRSILALGEIYRFQGRYDDAEPLLQESVQLSRQVLGDEHFWTLYYMHLLAYLYRDQGRYDDAGQLMVKVVEGRLHLFDENSGLLRRSIADLANMYTDQGRHDAAEQLLIETLERRRRLFGEKHELTEACITNLCLLYEMSGQFDKLKTLFLKLFERQRPGSDEGDAALAGYLNAHAWRQATHPAAEVRDGPRAIENATKACELSDWKNPEHVDTLAAAYAEVGDFASAVEWQRKVLELLAEEPRPRSDFKGRLKQYESGQPAYESCTRSVAWRNMWQGAYADAEQMLIKSLDFSRRLLGEEHPETRACLKHFVLLYEAWGKPEKAEQWRAKLPLKTSRE